MNKFCSVNWSEIPNFLRVEFSEDPELYADPELIYTLQSLRELYGKAIHPSPVKGALARFSGSESSQHYVGKEENVVRKSTAVDLFPEGVPFVFYSNILKIPTIKGIGIYLDTNGIDGKPWVMFHIDLRDRNSNYPPLVWIRKEGKYYYPQTDTSKWEILNDAKFFTYKTKSK